MFYRLVLDLHSWIRWLVLLTLIFAVYRSFKGWITASEFKRTDRIARNLASITVRVQFVIGVLLYVISPITQYFISNIKQAWGIPQVAMFGWMHPVGMIIAIALISIGEVRSKKAADDHKKFTRVAIFYTIALVIIFLSIPWPFMSNVSRPLFRTF
ncbi:MAG TPA: hypothetical protein VLX91_11055 [Candidatus Acidoferrales bacterium]|nr:hypothetical protein [Candidatus Acidoferrales bacterium]